MRNQLAATSPLIGKLMDRSAENRVRVRFGLGSLLLWATLFAMGMASERYYRQWTLKQLQRNYLDDIAEADQRIQRIQLDRSKAYSALLADFPTRINDPQLRSFWQAFREIENLDKQMEVRQKEREHLLSIVRKALNANR